MVYYSFVLLCYNKWYLTNQAIETFLESFSSELENQGIELIIVNNGSTDETYDNLQNIKNDYDGNISIEIINIKENIGYVLGLNEGISQVKGEIITVLNNDLIFPKNWFSGIVKSFELDKSIGIVVPFLSSAGSIQNLNVKLNSFDEIQSFYNFFTKKFAGNIIYVNRIISACLSIKKDIFNAIGGFDFWFGLGMYDDDDFCLRTLLCGYKIAVVGDSFVYHVSNATFSDYKEITNAAFAANRRKFMTKWNIDNVYNSQLRDLVIDKLGYDRLKHFFPTKFSDYTYVNKDENNHQNSSLFVADWTNPTSNWISKLNYTIINNPNYKIYFLIPNQYFNPEDILDELNIIIKSLSNSIYKIDYKIISTNVYPSDLLQFINNFENIICVENDFVNKYIINLAINNNINII